jgi:type IV pilus assembly protein PilE
MHPPLRQARHRGFTIIELMIAVAIVAILSAIALPSYNDYIMRSRVPPGLDALTATATRLEQRYQDTGNYANAAACGVAMPTPANFTVTCALGSGATANQSFTLTATGSGPLTGYTYTLTSAGARATTAHPKGTAATCWSIRGGTCDS